MSKKEYSVHAYTKVSNIGVMYGRFSSRQEADRCLVECAKRTDLAPGAYVKEHAVVEEDASDE